MGHNNRSFFSFYAGHIEQINYLVLIQTLHTGSDQYAAYQIFSSNNVSSNNVSV